MAKAKIEGLVKGIGINDLGTPATYTLANGKRTFDPYYQRWAGLLGRTATHGSFVCDEWKLFSNFVSDIKEMEVIHNRSVFDGKDCCLDKDLKYFGNKLYSRENCLLVSNMVNCLFQDSSTIRGSLPLGVTYRADLKSKDVFRAQISDPFTHIQTRKSFDCPVKAHRFWQETKLTFVLNVAEAQDPIVKKVLLDRADILRHDLEMNRETLSLSKVMPA